MEVMTWVEMRLRKRKPNPRENEQGLSWDIVDVPDRISHYINLGPLAYSFHKLLRVAMN